jgi:hypothetical protein
LNPEHPEASSIARFARLTQTMLGRGMQRTKWLSRRQRSIGLWSTNKAHAPINDLTAEPSDPF